MQSVIQQIFFEFLMFFASYFNDLLGKRNICKKHEQREKYAMMHGRTAVCPVTLSIRKTRYFFQPAGFDVCFFLFMVTNRSNVFRDVRIVNCPENGINWINSSAWLDVFWFYFESVTWFLLCTVPQVSWLRSPIFVTIIFTISTVTADHYLPKVNKINHKVMLWKVVLRLLSWLSTDLYLKV